eukprot:14722101-Alexandrium_andersonii.AAC.1
MVVGIDQDGNATNHVYHYMNAFFIQRPFGSCVLLGLDPADAREPDRLLTAPFDLKFRCREAQWFTDSIAHPNTSE